MAKDHIVEIESEIPEFKLGGLVERIVSAALEYEMVPFKCHVFVRVTDDSEIAELNLQHRGLNKATDVLSFPLLDMENGKYELQPEDTDPETDAVPIGDIVISFERAVSQANEYGHSVERETAFLATHSVFHLLGYDHENAEDELIMFRKQEEVLNYLELGR